MQCYRSGGGHISRGMTTRSHIQRNQEICGFHRSYHLGLWELTFAGLSFTWFNLQENPSLSKLDRFLVSSEWDVTFPMSKGVVLSRPTSNHMLILLNGRPLITFPHPFKFEICGLLIWVLWT